MGETVQTIRKTSIIGRACRERFLPLLEERAAGLKENGVTLAGISDLRRPYEMGRPDAEFHVMLYTLEGAGELLSGRGLERLTAGQVLLAPAHVPYRYRIHGGRWRIVWFHLADGPRWRLLGQPRVQVRPSRLTARVQAAVAGFLDESQGDAPGAERAARLFADLILTYLDRELDAGEDPRIRRVRGMLHTLWQQVSENLQHAWTVAELADRMAVSPVHLNRLCARFDGSTPMKMVTRLRMQKARELLRSTDYPLKRVAWMVGYDNPFAFSTAFKRFGGRCPRAFRGRPSREGDESESGGAESV
ncbi:MAG: AraC family transcriptional regulator [Kiritimatiellae bacterium]|nr:AraC family transcriptional regulator [Kiritimatiellia bacterium]